MDLEQTEFARCDGSQPLQLPAAEGSFQKEHGLTREEVFPTMPPPLRLSTRREHTQAHCTERECLAPPSEQGEVLRSGNHSTGCSGPTRR